MVKPRLLSVGFPRFTRSELPQLKPKPSLSGPPAHRGFQWAGSDAHIFNPYLGVGRYVRPIDSWSRVWLDRGAAGRSNCEHCHHHTSHSADTVSKLESP